MADAFACFFYDAACRIQRFGFNSACYRRYSYWIHCTLLR
jgi:hypothetical protein